MEPFQVPDGDAPAGSQLHLLPSALSTAPSHGILHWHNCYYLLQGAGRLRCSA